MRDPQIEARLEDELIAMSQALEALRRENDRLLSVLADVTNHDEATPAVRRLALSAVWTPTLNSTDVWTEDDAA